MPQHFLDQPLPPTAPGCCNLHPAASVLLQQPDRSCQALASLSLLKGNSSRAGKRQQWLLWVPIRNSICLCLLHSWSYWLRRLRGLHAPTYRGMGWGEYTRSLLDIAADWKPACHITCHWFSTPYVSSLKVIFNNLNILCYVLYEINRVIFLGSMTCNSASSTTMWYISRLLVDTKE